MLPEATALEHFHFLRPLWGLLLLPWALTFYLDNRRAGRPDIFGGIIAPHLLEHLRLARFRSRWFNPRSFSAVFVVLATLLLMGPSWRQQPSPLSEDQAALVILLDVSTTMGQRDVQPSRLERGKQKIRDLLALRQDKQAALVAYAGSAHPVLHLTADRDILEQYLAAIRPEIMPRAGKFPEYALPAVDDILRETDAPATVLLITDGPGADSAAPFEGYFASRPHQLLILGVGTAGDAQGLVPLERDALRDLARRAGGRYQDLTVDDRDVEALDRRVNSHYVVLENSALPWLDSGYALVFPAMALFLMWFRRGWTLTLGLALAPLLVALAPAPALAQQDPATAQPEPPGIAARFADLWLTGDQQGRLLMQFGRYRQAARCFDNPLWKGMAYYYAEDFMQAAEYFSRSDSDDALFNEANARAHARDYLRAVRRYDRLLARNPDYPGAAQNRARVQYLIDEINRLSASQQDEAGSVPKEGSELGKDDAIAAEGAQEIVWQQAELVQFSAEEILRDPDTAAMWLRGVQRDPADFLAAKFAMQLQAAERDGARRDGERQ